MRVGGDAAQASTSEQGSGTTPPLTRVRETGSTAGNAPRRKHRLRWVSGPLQLTVLALTIVTLSAAGSFAYGQTRPTLYAAEADIVLAPSLGFTDAGVNRLLVTEQVLITGRGVLDPVASAFGTTPTALQDRVSTSIVRQDSLALRVRAVGSTPEQAAELVRAILSQYEPVATQYGPDAPVGRRFMGPYPVPGQVQPSPRRDLALGIFAGILIATGVVTLVARISAHRGVALRHVKSSTPGGSRPAAGPAS